MKKRNHMVARYRDKQPDISTFIAALMLNNRYSGLKLFSFTKTPCGNILAYYYLILTILKHLSNILNATSKSGRWKDYQILKYIGNLKGHAALLISDRKVWVEPFFGLKSLVQTYVFHTFFNDILDYALYWYIDKPTWN